MALSTEEETRDKLRELVGSSAMDELSAPFPRLGGTAKSDGPRSQLADHMDAC